MGGLANAAFMRTSMIRVPGKVTKLDPEIKNLRHWSALLIGLFVAFELAGVQYGFHLRDISPLAPDPATGQIAPLLQGRCGDCSDVSEVYVTRGQLLIVNLWLGAAAACLLAWLGLLVAHGIACVRAERAVIRRRATLKRPRDPDA
jgi:hypothetical protein